METAEEAKAARADYNIKKSKNMETKTRHTRAGRPAMEGKTRRYIVADDVHEWIMQHGGGKYITDTMRTIMAVQKESK